jgi:superfamily II DNA or RNA helicase/HKD family nuclease
MIGLHRFRSCHPPDVARSLPDGAYEHPITKELDDALAGIEADRRQLGVIDDDESPAIIARHVATEVARVLGGLGTAGRAELARSLSDRLLSELAEFARAHDQDVAPILEQSLSAPPRRLLSIHKSSPAVRPATPLSSSTLLTRNHAEPALGRELAAELATADRVDAIVAFVTVGGVRLLDDVLESFVARGQGLRFRLLTTVFSGTTEVEAIDRLARLPGVEVRISYDVRRTRLHAKAWLFRRDTGLSTAYVGSANLTATALGGGQEWMVKVSAADLPQVIDKFEGTFDSLWQDPEFEAYDPTNAEARSRLKAALGAERSSPSLLTSLVALRPHPFQEEILERLRVERELHGRRRNLLVAATGTGKTVIAACDYARVCAAAGTRPRLLFMAHRKEILIQARDTFRHALQDAAFGELLADGHRPQGFEHLFATIQSASASDLIGRLGPTHFRHVIIDECHHLPAPSYQAVVSGLTPDILVGLTATPERSDGKSLLPDFDGHVAHELRLWQALDQHLLIPFEYFGISDSTDLRSIRWSRTGYDLAALSDLYTAHDARAALVLAQLARRVADVRRVRALGFCVSIEHARFMAIQFQKAGIPAQAVHGDSTADERSQAAARLREREVNVLFTCDLYNEGIDLPFVDTLLLLRPTQSATLFLQQLGRGLRFHERKTSCLVLDFIGQQHERFRFDPVLTALTGIPRTRLAKAVESGFPFLPSGCAVQLDRVARDEIVRSLRTALSGSRTMITELRELAAERRDPLKLIDYLTETGRELEDVYHAGGWTTLKRRARLADGDDPGTEELSRRLGWLSHVDDPARLQTYRKAICRPDDSPLPDLSPGDRRRLEMLDCQLWERGDVATAEETVSRLRSNPAIVGELSELHEVLDERIASAGGLHPEPDWSLALHHQYTRREILAGVGFVTAGQKKKALQGGILKLDDRRCELLFVTLDKSGTGFSPSTRYRDYAISRELFHWETQGAASVSRPSGRRYIDSPTTGMAFHLFVRSAPGDPFTFLGPVVYQSHTGDRPIAITWRLTYPMPARLFERYATLWTG